MYKNVCVYHVYVNYNVYLGNTYHPISWNEYEDKGYTMYNKIPVRHILVIIFDLDEPGICILRLYLHCTYLLGHGQ